MTSSSDNPSGTQPVVASLTERSRSRAISSAAQQPVRALVPKGEKLASRAAKIYRALLYRDETVILEMRNRVTAAALRDENVLEKLKRIIVGKPLLSGSSTFDGLTGVDEFVVKPTAKWNLGAEVGAEIELKWNLGSDKSLDNVIFILFSVMPPKRLGDLVQRAKIQNSTTSTSDLIYPGMPVNMLGFLIDSNDIGLCDIQLHDKRHSARLLLDKEHRLDQLGRSLEKRPVHILGLIHDIDETINVKVGAIAAGHWDDIDFNFDRAY